jgi:hypothetical protein
MHILSVLLLGVKNEAHWSGRAGSKVKDCDIKHEEHEGQEDGIY